MISWKKSEKYKPSLCKLAFFLNILTYEEVGNCHVLGMKFDMSTIV